jgi:hypothetical protein
MHLHKGKQRQPNFRRINLRTIPGDNALIFQLVDSLRDSRRGKRHAPPQLVVREPRVLLKLTQNTPIGGIDNLNRPFALPCAFTCGCA